MLLNLLRGGDLIDILLAIVVVFPSVLFALTFHEVAHGWVAYKLGDPTAHSLGRLTLNPLKHLDPIGTILMLVTGYGWAKPVPVNTRYFKNPKKGMALTALAGPATNLILGLLSMTVYAMLYRLSMIPYLQAATGFAAVIRILVWIVTLLFYYFAMINVTYAVFNLFPVPPFDGSRILLLFLPTKWYFAIMKHERTIMIIVLIGMASGILWTPIEYAIDWVISLFEALAFLIFPY